MSAFKQIVLAFLLALYLFYPTAAQDSAAPQRSFPTITAAASGERVRITAPASIVQMHLEVYAASGEKLFDQEIRGGNVFDWHLQDGQGQRLAAGSYVCVVTAKSISGKLTQKIGTLNVAEKSVSVQPASSSQLSAVQAQTIGPVEDNSSWTIAGNEPETTTVIAHDGTDGQMIRGRGALSFRIGNFFSGSDTEQMRLTEAGRLGIGTSDPQTTLDVAGTIRAQRFLVVKPKSARADKTASNTPTADAVDPGQSLISGTGTQDRVAKWIDNSGTLGDSSITDTGGFVGIGTTTPGSKLVVSANSATLPPATGVARFADADGVQTSVFADAFGTNPIFNVRRANGTAASPSAVQASQVLGVIGASGYGASAYMGTRARVGFFASENWTNTANGTFLTFNTTADGAATPGGSERMRIDNFGNVGIGTTATSSTLAVGQSNTGPGTIAETNGSAIITGTNTEFMNTFVIGDSIVAPGLPGGTIVTQISSDTLMIVSAAANATASNLTYTLAGGTRMAVKGSGNVGIGTIAPAQRLQVIGNIQIGTSGTNGCLMNFTGNAIVGTCSSDRRMKRDITPFPRLLDQVVKLQPVNFYWRRAEFPGRHFGPAQSYGLVAQDVEQVLPELVSKDERGYRMVDYSKLPLLLLQAVKDLKAENMNLQRRNEIIDARLRLIERRLKNRRGAISQRR
jgi:hypothetical protein